MQNARADTTSQDVTTIGLIIKTMMAGIHADVHRPTRVTLLTVVADLERTCVRAFRNTSIIAGFCGVIQVL